MNRSHPRKALSAKTSVVGRITRQKTGRHIPPNHASLQFIGGDVIFALSGSLEERQPFFATQFAVAAWIDLAKQAVDKIRLLNPRIAFRPIQVIGRDFLVAIAVQSREPCG